MSLLFARAFFIVFMASVLAFKVWSQIADERRQRANAKLALRRPDYAKIARLERELGIATDPAIKK
jgi:hypothetical protein